jgi:hypothetical protein
MIKVCSSGAARSLYFSFAANPDSTRMQARFKAIAIGVQRVLIEF